MPTSPAALEPRAAELQRQPASFDPLATVLAKAQRAGLRVHAWVNVNLVSSAADLPIAPTHIVHRHPEWLMVPRDLVQELSRVPEDSPAYVGKLARWTRAQSRAARGGQLEGLYASPLLPAAADHVNAVVRDIATRYAVDGVHLDYARYPTERFDYSRGADPRVSRGGSARSSTAAVRRELDGQEAEDPLAYPDSVSRRMEGVPHLAPDGARRPPARRRSRRRVRARSSRSRPRRTSRRPAITGCRTGRLAAGGPRRRGLPDGLHARTRDASPSRLPRRATSRAGSAVWAGIGAYRLPPAQTIENIETARRLGAAGVVLFSYDSLIDPRQASPDYIAVVGRSAFAKPAAASQPARGDGRRRSMTLTWLDYTVIAGYLVAITAFGSWFARFQKTTRDYFLNDRSVPWWAICFTIVATETSTLSFIGVPAQAFAGNMTFLQLAIGYIIGRLLVSVLFIPAYFRGDLFTSYELLQRRFGPGVKNVAAVIFVVTRTLADGVRLFATALVIAVVTQVPVTLAIVLIGAAMIVYTTRGGVSAVIWTDVVQMFIYVAGALVVFCVAAAADRRRLGRGRVPPAKPRASSASSISPSIRTRVYTLLGGTARRRRADARHARHRSVSWCSGCSRRNPRRAAATGLVLSGVDRLRAVRALPDDRRRAVRLLPADAAAAAARQQRRNPAALRRHVALARRRRLHRRRHRRGGALAVDQRPRRHDGQRLLPEVRAA